MVPLCATAQSLARGFPTKPFAHPREKPSRLRGDVIRVERLWTITRSALARETRYPRRIWAGLSKPAEPGLPRRPGDPFWRLGHVFEVGVGALRVRVGAERRRGVLAGPNRRGVRASKPLTLG